MNKHRIVSNLLIMGSGHMTTWLISAAYMVLVGRYLGPSRYGELALATAIVTLLTMLNGVGMEDLITRTIARTPESGGLSASAALFVRVLLAIPMPLVLASYVYFAHLNPETAAAGYILAAGMIVKQLDKILKAVFRGHERMSYVSAAEVVENALVLIFTAVAALVHGGVILCTAAISASTCVVLVLDFHWARRFVQLSWRVPWPRARAVVVDSFGFWANYLFATFYFQIDSLILGAIAGTQAVGFYAPAGRVVGVIFFAPAIINAVTQPLLSRLGVDPSRDFDQVSRKTLSLLIVCAVPATIGLMTFAGPIVLILFGAAYAPSVPVLVVLSLLIPLTFLNTQMAVIMISRDQQWRWSTIMGISAVLNPLANLILIRLGIHAWHNGAVGAAVALDATELLMALYGVVALHRTVLHSSMARISGAALLAGAAQLATIALLGTHLALGGEVLGLAVYLAVSLALGAVPRRDVLLLWQTATRRSSTQAAA